MKTEEQELATKPPKTEKSRGTRLIRIADSAHEYLTAEAKRRGVTVAGLVSEGVLMIQDDRRAVRVAEALGRRFDDGREALVEALGESLGNVAGRVAALDADINVLSAQLAEISKLVAFTAPEPVDGVLANLAGHRRLAAMEREVVGGLVRQGGRVISKTVAKVTQAVDQAGDESEA